MMKYFIEEYFDENGTVEFNPDYLKRDYEKQETCIPKKIYFKCYSCQFTASENDIPKIIEHLNRCKEKSKKRVEIILELSKI